MYNSNITKKKKQVALFTTAFDFHIIVFLHAVTSGNICGN